MEDDNNNINPVAVLPIKHIRVQINWQLCAICQSFKPCPVSQGSSQGVKKLENSYEIRTRLNDDVYFDTLQKLQPYIHELTEHQPKWHKSCYSAFTYLHT